MWIKLGLQPLNIKMFSPRTSCHTDTYKHSGELIFELSANSRITHQNYAKN